MFSYSIYQLNGRIYYTSGGVKGRPPFTPERLVFNKRMDRQRALEFKQRIYDQFAELGKAFGNPRRLEILVLLAQAERNVEEIARETGMSIASVSQHLQLLRNVHLVTVRRDGVKANYSLADKRVFRLVKTLHDLGESQLAEIERLVNGYLPQRHTLGVVSMADLQDRRRAGDVYILDVRPATEYQHGHISGAVSIPLDELHARLTEIPKQRNIIVYCRSRYSTLSDLAVSQLQAQGFNAQRLEAGFPEWQLAGYPVDNLSRPAEQPQGSEKPVKSAGQRN